ncbi:TadE/TadG family type IV pilus assembly protein [Devosia sp.]|uniref:TadE/TadG family type IV pilus assembly protein n=1 Tax=Devosia sp. TaxID=1871048 RepID=UPI003A8D70DD
MRQFRTQERGVAAVEFALILPFLLLLYFGTVEAASLYTVDRRVYTIAGTMGDLVSREDTSIATATLNDYFAAAQNIMRPYSTNGLRQVLSLIEVADDGSVTVSWSRGFNGGIAREADSQFPLDANEQLNLMARGDFLVVSEIEYAYTPMFGMVISGPINLNRAEYYLPRFEGGIALD